MSVVKRSISMLLGRRGARQGESFPSLLAMLLLMTLPSSVLPLYNAAGKSAVGFNIRCSTSATRARVICCDDLLTCQIEAFLSNMKDGEDDEECEAEWDDCERLQQELEEERNYPAKALAEQAFLGPGEPLPLLESSQSAVAAAAAVSAEGPGIVRLEHVLSAELAAELRKFVLSQLAEARDQAERDDGSEIKLSNVLAPEVRWDVRLPMRSVVRRALLELLADGAPLGGAFEIASGGRDAELWELAALVSAPGAASQIVHADCDGSPNPPLLHTAFVALQPVSQALGPTRWLPTTHSDAAAHAAVNTKGDVTILRGDDGIGPPLSYIGLLDTGDASLYDGRILHCGGTNEAGSTDDGDGLRVLFHTTF